MTRPISNAGLPTDHDAFKAMTEIEMIAKQASRIFDRLLPSDLTRAQFGVVNRLARLDACETISEIARVFDVAQPTMTSTVRRLLDKGYVRTEADPEDGRRKIVRLTQDGAKARATVVDSLTPLFSTLSDADFDPSGRLSWATLLDQLAVLRNRLEKM